MIYCTKYIYLYFFINNNFGELYIVIINNIFIPVWINNHDPSTNNELIIDTKFEFEHNLIIFSWFIIVSIKNIII